MGFFNINGVASSTLNYTFEKDVLYSHPTNSTNNASVNLRNPTVLTGHYNATYNFDVYHDEWNNTNQAYINNSIDGHNGVLTTYGINSEDYLFNDCLNGTVEFWVKTQSGDPMKTYLNFYEDTTTCINFRISWGDLYYYNGTDTLWFNIIEENWNHIRISWENDSTVDIYLNDLIAFNNVSMFNSMINGLNWFRFGTNDNYESYLDSFGVHLPGNNYYSIGDNIVPYLKNDTSDGIDYEVDLTDFKYEGWNDKSDVGDDNPSGWTDIESGYDYTNIIVDPDDSFDRAVEIEGNANDGGKTGLEREFGIEYGNLNISWSFEYTQQDKLNGYYDFDVYSSDSTLVSRIRLRDDALLPAGLYYYKGTGYTRLVHSIAINERLEFSLFIDYSSDTCVLWYYKDGTLQDRYFYSLIETGKDGLSKIEFYSDPTAYVPNYDQVGYIDYIGVYVNGTSQSLEFGSFKMYYAYSDYWYFVEQNLFSIIGEGNFGIYLTSFFYIEDITDFSTIQSATDYDGVEIVYNLYDHVHMGSGESYKPNIWIQIYNRSSVSEISIGGVKLTESANIYWLEYTHGNINVDESYFYVDSSNRLQFNLVVNDNNTEFIQAEFNIGDVSSENRSISFLSNINGESQGYLFVDYNDDTSNSFEFPYYTRTTTVILPQTKVIESLIILITDNDLDDNDICTGYITNLRLIYNPDLAITLTTLNLLGIIVPLIVLIVPPLSIRKKFGDTGVLVMFMLMALVCVVASLIPIWLFFIIAVGTIGFLVMKEKVGFE